MAITRGMSLGVNFRSLIPGASGDLFDADDLNMLSYPLWGKIDSTAIPALLDLFLDQLLAVNLKLRLSGERRFFRREGGVRNALFLLYHNVHDIHGSVRHKATIN